MVSRENSHFRSRIGNAGPTYICNICGKRTRETGHGESSVGLCKACLQECEEENRRADGRTEA